VSSTFEAIAARRAQLIARSEQQRRQLAAYHRQVVAPVQVTTSVFGLMNSLRRSPLFITAVAAILLRTRWGKLALVPKFAWRGWKVLRFVREVRR
jgi:hypothetical protein